MGRGEDRAVDRAVDEAFDALGVVALRGQDDDPHAGALEALVEDVEELEVERVVEVLDDDPDAARAAPREAAAAVARDVAEPLGGGQHAVTGGLGHARVAAQRARHRRLRDAGRKRDVVARGQSPARGSGVGRGRASGIAGSSVGIR